MSASHQHQHQHLSVHAAASSSASAQVTPRSWPHTYRRVQVRPDASSYNHSDEAADGVVAVPSNPSQSTGPDSNTSVQMLTFAALPTAEAADCDLQQPASQTASVTAHRHKLSFHRRALLLLSVIVTVTACYLLFVYLSSSSHDLLYHAIPSLLIASSPIVPQAQALSVVAPVSVSLPELSGLELDAGAPLTTPAPKPSVKAISFPSKSTYNTVKPLTTRLQRQVNTTTVQRPQFQPSPTPLILPQHLKKHYEQYDLDKQKFEFAVPPQHLQQVDLVYT